MVLDSRKKGRGVWKATCKSLSVIQSGPGILQAIEAFHQRCPENPKPAAETLAEPEAAAKKRSPRRGRMLENLGVAIDRG
jgi:hypothetical protein